MKLKEVQKVISNIDDLQVIRGKDLKEIISKTIKSIEEKESTFPNKEFIEVIVKKAAEICMVNYLLLYQKTRQQHVVLARSLVMWHMYENMGYSYTATGRFFKKDHATVIYLVNKIKQANKNYYGTESFLKIRKFKNYIYDNKFNRNL